MLEFLPNNYAAISGTTFSGMGASNGLNPATGYQNSFGVVGNRDWYYKTAPSTASSGYGYAQNGNRVSPDYYIIGGAHKLLTQNFMDVVPYRADATPSYTFFSAKNPISVSDLTGRYNQDFIVDVPSSTANRQHGFRFRDAGGGNSAMFSCLYVSTAFDFGTNPVIGSVDVTPEFSDFRPRFSSIVYKTEARITLSFEGITQAKCEAFKGLANIYSWPIFIYDADGDVFPYELEHVILETYVEQRIGVNDYLVDLQFRRLKHYD